MSKTPWRLSRNEILHLGRAIIAIFALLEAAAHLAFVIPSGTSTHAGTGPGPMSFNEIGFWFDVEVIAYSIIAVVFLLGLRTWYPLSLLFNVFNLGIYLLSGITAIPGITGNVFPGRFQLPIGLTTLNIIVVSWVAVFVLGLVLYKYDPGSKLDKLLVTRSA